MKISVVMATYNGEKYILEQMKSLSTQKRKPDEVIICDDGSQDRTVSLIKQFIFRNGLENSWRIIENSERKGVTKNFLDGVEIADGDIIFYCDQDDIWEPSKIHIMEKGFSLYPDMYVCCCLQDYINATGDLIHIKFQFMFNIPKRRKTFQKISLEEAIKYNKSPGLCLAVKRDFILEIRGFILRNGLTHDLPLGTVAAIKNGYYLLNRKLVRYRLHGDNISTPRYSIKSRINNITEQIRGRENRYRQMKAVYKEYGNLLSDKERKELYKAICETRGSIELLNKRDTFGLMKMLLTINPMMNPWIALNNCLASLMHCRLDS